MWATTDDLSESVRFDDRADEAIGAASHILWALSGRKYSGTRSVVEYYDSRQGLGWNAQLGSVQLQAVIETAPGAPRCLDCGFPHKLRLRHTPVQRILSVQINGESLAPGEYALINRAAVGFPYTRLACGAQCVRVSYLWGVNPPAGGRAAAVRLAEQFLLAWDGSDDCRFPKRVTNVTRQGVSWTILDPQDFLDDGRTGLYEVDLFLKTTNPDKARRPARVFSPDMPRAQTILQDVTPPNIMVDATDLGLVAPGAPAWYVIPADLIPLTSHTLYAVINGVTYDDTHFQTNGDDSVTLVLSGLETSVMSNEDPFVIKAHPSVGVDTTLVSGLVRFVQA